jgi:hypothetical protein
MPVAMIVAVIALHHPALGLASALLIFIMILVMGILQVVVVQVLVYGRAIINAQVGALDAKGIVYLVRARVAIAVIINVAMVYINKIFGL